MVVTCRLICVPTFNTTFVFNTLMYSMSSQCILTTSIEVQTDTSSFIEVLVVDISKFSLCPLVCLHVVDRTSTNGISHESLSGVNGSNDRLILIIKINCRVTSSLACKYCARPQLRSTTDKTTDTSSMSCCPPPTCIWHCSTLVDVAQRAQRSGVRRLHSISTFRRSTCVNYHVYDVCYVHYACNVYETSDETSDACSVCVCRICATGRLVRLEDTRLGD